MELSFIETQRWVRFFPNTILEKENIYKLSKRFIKVSYVINVVGVQEIVTCDVAKVLLIVMKSGIHSTVTSSFSLFFLHVRKILRNFAVT